MKNRREMTKTQRIIDYGVSILGTTYDNEGEWYEKMSVFMHSIGFVNDIPTDRLLEMCKWVVDFHDPEFEDEIRDAIMDDWMLSW